MTTTSDAGKRGLLSVRRSLRRQALVSCCEIFPGSREVGIMPEQLMELRGHGEGFLRWQGDKVRKIQVDRLSPAV